MEVDGILFYGFCTVFRREREGGGNQVEPGLGHSWGGGLSMIASSAIQQFKSRFRGMLLAPGDQDYDSARNVFNAMINRRPELIAQCTNTGM